MKSLLQKLIPDKIQIHKLTISGLTGEVLSSQYYLSVEDYNTINETINSIICAYNTVILSQHINFNSLSTVTSSIQSVINLCPIITGINGEKIEGIINYDNLTTFYLNDNKYCYNPTNLGVISVDDLVITGQIGSYVTKFNGQLYNVGDGGINENFITGAISGISINNVVHYPYETYYWDSTITALPLNTTFFKDGQRILVSERTELVSNSIAATGKCNNYVLTDGLVLSTKVLTSFNIDPVNDYYIEPNTYAFIDDKFTNLTNDSSGYIDIDLNLRLDDPLDGLIVCSLKDDLDLYLIKGTASSVWNSSVKFLLPFTSALIDGTWVEITSDKSMPISNIVASGLYEYTPGSTVVFTDKTKLYTSYNGNVNLGYYLIEGQYINSINDKTELNYRLLSSVRYTNSDNVTTVISYNNMTTNIDVNNSNYIKRNINSDGNTVLTYNSNPLTLTSSSIDDRSAITLNELIALPRRDVISAVAITGSSMILLLNWYPLHVYNSSGQYISNGVTKIEIVNNKINITLSITAGTLTIMKVG